MKVNRVNFIAELESVAPGLGMKGEEMQANCFIFKEGAVGTFNGEVCCRRLSIIPFTAPVPAEPLMGILQKITREEVDCDLIDHRFVVSCKNERARIKVDATIESPLDTIESAEKWAKIHDDFLEAIALVHESASEDASQFNLTCLHIHPNWIEACDNWQLARFKLETGISTPVLVKQKAIKHIVGLGPTKFAETPSFIHFRRPDKLVISCRRYIEQYPELTHFLKTEGSKWTIPKGLKEAAEKGELFAEKGKASFLKLSIQPGKVTLTAEGLMGEYTKVGKLEYKGESLTFRISPVMLKNLVERHNDVLVSQKKIKVNSGKYEFAAALELPDKKKEKKNAKRKEDSGEGGDDQD